MRALIITCLAVLATAATVTTTSAQQVRAAVGIRAGFPTGISGKYFVTNNIAVEVTGGVRSHDGFNTKNIGGGLFFYMDDLGMDKGLMKNVSLYGGAGIGRSYYNYSDEFLAGVKEQTGTLDDGRVVTRKGSYDDFSTNFKAYIGAQYVFPNAPIELTLDFGPNIHTGKTANAIGGHAAVGARYILCRQKAAVR